MRNIVKFGNETEIEPEVWSTFGVSVKTGSNPIGMFGTGLKYAIAVLLREGRHIRITSAGREYAFDAVEKNIRGKAFNICRCNGKDLPFTTELGKTWELWQAYRELYSNCLDEGGELGAEDVTTIYAELSDISLSDIALIDREPIFTSDSCDIYFGKSNRIYYRGFRAMDSGETCMFTYDIKSPTDLTEDRTIKHSFAAQNKIGNVWNRVKQRNLLEDLYLSSKDMYEQKLNFGSLSDELIDVVESSKKIAGYKHANIYEAFLALNRSGSRLPIKLSDHQQAVLDKAKSLAEKINFPIMYPVVVTNDLSADVLGTADYKIKTIFIAGRAIDQGVKQTIATLIEENLHLNTGLDDCTYNMQNHLFDIIVSQGLASVGEVI